MKITPENKIRLMEKELAEIKDKSPPSKPNPPKKPERVKEYKTKWSEDFGGNTPMRMDMLIRKLWGVYHSQRPAEQSAVVQDFPNPPVIENVSVSELLEAMKDFSFEDGGTYDNYGVELVRITPLTTSYPNKNYDKEVKAYEIKFARYNELKAAYKTKMAEHREQKKENDRLRREIYDRYLK